MPRQRERRTFPWCQYGWRFGTSARSWVESTTIQNNNNSRKVPRRQNLPSRHYDNDLCGKKRERQNCAVSNGCIRRRYIVCFVLLLLAKHLNFRAITVCHQHMSCFTSEYVNDHIFEPRRKIWRHDWSSQLYTQLKVIPQYCIAHPYCAWFHAWLGRAH